MATEFRILRTDGAGGCACPTCAASGPTTTTHDRAPDPPSLDDVLRATAEFGNAHVDKIRVVEFLPREIEVDHAIVGWDASSGTAKPILARPWPDHDRWALFYSSFGSDYAATSTERYVASDGFTAPDVVSMRRHFKTTLADSERPAPVVDSPRAAQGAAPELPDLAEAIRRERHLPAPFEMSSYDASKPDVPDPPDLCEYIRQHRKGAQA